MALFSASKPASDNPAKGGKGKQFAADVPMPEGNHKAKVVRVIPKQTSNGKLMFSVKWEDDFNRSAWQNIIVSPESPKAMAFFYRQMAVFGLTQAIIEAEDTTEEDIANDMTGAEALVTVEHEDYNGKKYTKVRWVEAV